MIEYVLGWVVVSIIELSSSLQCRLLYGLLNPIYPLLLKQCVPRGNDESKVWLPVISLQEDVEAVACSVASATGTVHGGGVFV